MMRAMYTAASGMMAQQLNIDNISNNLANVQSVGYKKSRVDFQDLLYAHMQDPNAEGTASTQVGMGVKVVSTQKLFTAGQMQQTNDPNNFAIQGDGFFSVKTGPGAGDVAYTRDGGFKFDGKSNQIVNSSGLPIQIYSPKGGLQYGLTLPKGVTSVAVDADGKISGVGMDGKTVDLGTIALTKFLNPAGLKAVGGNLYQGTSLAGSHVTGKPNDTKIGLGAVAQGFLEKSNVNVVEEMISIVQAQRAFEMSQKGVQAADEMMRMTNQMQKG